VGFQFKNSDSANGFPSASNSRVKEKYTIKAMKIQKQNDPALKGSYTIPHKYDRRAEKIG
jgi:hypothetical protein